MRYYNDNPFTPDPMDFYEEKIRQDNDDDEDGDVCNVCGGSGGGEGYYKCTWCSGGFKHQPKKYYSWQQRQD